MSKKKVLDYDPKTGFGNFAEIMNANNAIDMAQNKVNAGMAPVTAPVANPAAPVTGAPMKLETPTPTPVVADAAAVSGDVVATGGGATVDTATETGATATPITSTAITSGPEQSEADWYAAQGLDPDKDYEEARAALEYDYETSMATYGQRAEELYQMGLSNSGVSDIYQLGAFNAYLKSQNDLAYQRIEAKKKNKQAYLAYDKEYQAGVKADTANAYNFGLEQFDWEMGEDGSFTTNNAENIRAQLLAQGYDAGIVDNVVNMLTALDPATLPTEKAQAAERKKAQEEANAKEELKSTATRLAFNAYNGENIGEVETLLLNTPGVDSQMAKKILEYLGELTPEQLAESTAYKKKQEENKATFDAQVKEATTIAENIWSGAILSATGKGYSGSVRKELEKQGFSKEVIDEAVNWINEMSKEDAIKWHYDKVTNIYDALVSEGLLKDYDGKDFSKKSLSDSMKAAGYAQWTIDAVIRRADEMLKYKTEIETDSTNMVTVTGEDGTDYTIDRNVLNSGLSILGNAELPIGAAKETIAKILGPDFSEDDIDAIYARFAQIEAAGKEEMERSENEQKTEASDTVVSNIQGISDSEVSVSGMATTLKEAATNFGKDSDEYKKIASEVSSKLKSTIDWALSENDAGVADNLAEAYTLAGMSYDEWNNPETFGVEEKYLESAQFAHLITLAGEQHKKGLINYNDYSDIIDSWINNQAEVALEVDKTTLQATGLNDISYTVGEMKNYLNRGFMSKDMYYNGIDQIINDMKIDMDGSSDIRIKWGDVGSEITVKFNFTTYTSINDTGLTDKLNEYAENGTKTITLYDAISTGIKEYVAVAHNDKIYYRSVTGNDWYEADSSTMFISGDGVSANNEERENIYSIIARYFDLEAARKKSLSTAKRSEEKITMGGQNAKS